MEAVGKPGFWMYEQFREMVDPVPLTRKTQHTPKLERERLREREKMQKWDPKRIVAEIIREN